MKKFETNNNHLVVNYSGIGYDRFAILTLVNITKTTEKTACYTSRTRIINTTPSNLDLEASVKKALSDKDFFNDKDSIIIDGKSKIIRYSFLGFETINVNVGLSWPVMIRAID